MPATAAEPDRRAWHPGPPSPLLQSVEQCLRDHGLRAAVAHCYRWRAEHGASAALDRYLALLHAQLGHVDAARRSIKSASEAAPDDPQVWLDYGRVLGMQGQFADAAACFDKAIVIEPAYADAWHNRGLAASRTGHPERAFEAFKHALLLDPERADTYLGLGNLLVRAGQLDDAIEAYSRAARLDPALAPARIAQAQTLASRGYVKRATELYRQSLKLDESQVTAWYGLGQSLEDLGDAGAARDCYINALRRDPQHAPSLGQLLGMIRDRTETSTDEFDVAPWVARAQALLEDAATPNPGRALVGYGLAKFHDRRGDLAAAAAAGLAANAARRADAGPLNRAELETRIEAIAQAYDPDFFRGRQRFGLATAQPVFIVGLPRSGTTLTEQVIAAHPKMHGAGELPDLPWIARRVAGPETEPWRAAGLIEERAAARVATEYLKALRRGAPAGMARITDKTPLNAFHLGLVATLFPRARVVWCRRALADNALSIWFENFNAEQHYATDFGDLRLFGEAVDRLMRHWQAALPLPIHVVDYEAMVGDLETTARDLVAFLGVPWDDACLDFYATGRAVQTPSRWQVRQQIYTRALGRAQRYAPHLPDLATAFPHLAG